MTAAESPIRVVIVDDHPAILWGLERLIESAAPRMMVAGKATTLAEARELIGLEQPDVVLLDLDLGSENGLDAIPELLRISSARILVLTGVRDTATHEAAIRAGALGVAGKETASEELLQSIQRVSRGELTIDQRITQHLLAGVMRRDELTWVSPEEERLAALTTRERDIVERLMEQPEVPLKTVAASIGISERTLRNHLSSIYEKLGVSGRLELYVFTTRQLRG